MIRRSTSVHLANVLLLLGAGCFAACDSSEPAPTVGAGGAAASAGTAGSAGSTAGNSGTAGTSGSSGTAGSTGGSSGTDGGTGGGGTGGGGTAGGGTGGGGTGGGGTGGSAGTAGSGGGGTGGSAGTGAISGSAGTAGTGGSGGSGGSGGASCDPALCPDPGNECLVAICDPSGQCSVEPVADGTVVASQLTGDCKVNQCQAGAVTPVNDDNDLPVDGSECTDDVCTAGVPTNPVKAANTPCGQNGAFFCDGNGSCSECTAPDQCTGQDTECQTRTCNMGTCGIAFTQQGTALSSQTVGDCQIEQCDGMGGTETVADPGDIEDDGNACTTDTCNQATPVHTPVAVNTPCGGTLKCDAAGQCVGCVTENDCPAPGNDCLVATCNAGACGTANKADGTGCDDGNACTQTDTCQSGACQGVNPVVCTAQDQCHDVGTCNSATGQCSNPNKANGSSCSDGNACTQTDTCQSGTCTGGNSVTCSALDVCHVAGTCNPGTGVCSNPNAANGTACSDGNSCTQTDSCQAGTCVGANPVTCNPLDQCHNAGTCNPANGQCTNPNKANGTSCSDNDLCTQTDTCQAGTCTGANPVTCSALDQCHTAGSCNPATGTCSNPNKADGSSCNDGNLCTQTDTCQAGACTGGNPVTCTALDQCHDVGTCNAGTGTCSNPNKANGTSCNDGNLCTQTDTCQAGACTGGNPVTCSPLDQCHSAGTCNVATGTCSNPNQPAGTSCNFSGGAVCDGAGSCIQCITPADCGTNTACKSYTCNAGICGQNNVANGTVVSNPVSGDCKSNQCDGSGNIVTNANDNADVPSDDGNQCTSESCTTGNPVHPPVSPGGSCNQNGGTQCDGAGSCVQCITPADCGTDTSCKSFTCTAGVCGQNNAPNGTVISNPTAGDCKSDQCDGSGNLVTNANDNADLPVDGNQCTSDVCTAGVASNPAVMLGTSCSQNGGTLCDGSGSCVAAPDVSSTSPADGASASPSTTIAVNFTQAMDSTSLTVQTTNGSCTGSIQVSANDFLSCIGFGAAAPTMSNGNQTATWTPNKLFHSTNYKIRVTTAVKSAVGLNMAAQFTQPTGFVTTSAPQTCGTTPIVISQVYGGGGNTAATYKNDYVELHNRSAKAVNVSTWSIQYASTSGTTWQRQNLSGSIQPGAYYLVKLAGAAAANGVDLPTADVTGTIDLSGSNGKVALVANQTSLSGGCPTGLVDFVGYGTANCFEGAGAVPALSNSTAGFRNSAGCTDSDVNSVDFTVATPLARNSGSAAAYCGCSANELDVATEADYCVLQFPTSINVTAGQSTPSVYSRIFETGVTEAAGANASVYAQCGYGPNGSNPTTSTAWRFFDSTFNVQVGNDDEYQSVFTAPAAGSYAYTCRFSQDIGSNWTYCDINGAGSNGGLTFESAQLGAMTTTP